MQYHDKGNMYMYVHYHMIVMLPHYFGACLSCELTRLIQPQAQEGGSSFSELCVIMRTLRRRRSLKVSGRLWRRLWEMSSLLSFSHNHVMSAGRPGGGREGGREVGREGGREGRGRRVRQGWREGRSKSEETE